MNEQPKNKEIWPKRLYRSLVDFIAFVVGHTSDQGADVAIRALPLLVPLPNAISMYFVSKTVLGFTHEQALAFAAAIECAMFGLIEVALHMFDGYLKDKRRYLWPFYISLGVVGLVTIIIIVLVYQLEIGAQGHTILALLPVMSCASAVGLGLKRWHNRNESQEVEQKRNEWEHEQIRLEVEHARKLEIERVRATRKTVNSAVNKRTEAPVHTPDDSEKTGEVDTNALLEFYTQNPASSLRKTGAQFGVSHTQISKVLKRLEADGKVSVNGVVKVL